MSRWDVAVMDKVPDALRDRLALAIGLKTYRAYRDLMSSDRWQRLAKSGARMQRLLWASTSTKDPKAPDALLVEFAQAGVDVDALAAKLQAHIDEQSTALRP